MLQVTKPQWKVMLIMFFNLGMVHYEFVPEIQPVLLPILNFCWSAWDRPFGKKNAGKNGEQFDTAPLRCPFLHIPHGVAAFGEEPNCNHLQTTILCISCSKKLRFFPTTLTGLSGQCLVSAEDIQQETTAGLTAIPKEDFQRCFQQQQGHWS